MSFFDHNSKEEKYLIDETADESIAIKNKHIDRFFVVLNLFFLLSPLIAYLSFYGWFSIYYSANYWYENLEMLADLVRITGLTFLLPISICVLVGVVIYVVSVKVKKIAMRVVFFIIITLVYAICGLRFAIDLFIFLSVDHIFAGYSYGHIYTTVMFVFVILLAIAPAFLRLGEVIKSSLNDKIKRRQL